MDLNGFGIGKMNRKTWDLVKLLSSVAQDNYPEILAANFIINAPMVFSGVWAIAKNFLDEKTRKKIHIYGSSYKKKLLDHIDEENLPEMYGGKSTDSVFADPGPWNNYDIIMKPRVGLKHKVTG